MNRLLFFILWNTGLTIAELGIYFFSLYFIDSASFPLPVVLFFLFVAFFLFVQSKWEWQALHRFFPSEKGSFYGLMIAFTLFPLPALMMIFYISLLVSFSNAR